MRLLTPAGIQDVSTKSAMMWMLLIQNIIGKITQQRVLRALTGGRCSSYQDPDIDPEPHLVQEIVGALHGALLEAGHGDAELEGVVFHGTQSSVNFGLLVNRVLDEGGFDADGFSTIGRESGLFGNEDVQ